MRAFSLPLLILIASVTPGLAQDSPPDYARDVAPLLKKYCAGCHNDGDLEGDFSLESYASLQKGTPDGPAVLPGDPQASRMIRVLTGAAEPQMPPEGEPAPTADEIARLAAWIEAGATGPEGAEPDRMTLIVPHIAPQTDTRPIAALAWSPDGARLAIARYGAVTLSSVGGDGVMVEDGKSVGPFPGKVNAVHFTPDGQRLVTASGVNGLGGIAALWNAGDATLIREFKGHRDTLYDAELSPDGTILATCSYDRQIILWNAATGERLRTLEGHNGAVYDVAFSPDGTVLASASADDTCKVWRVSDGERLDTLGQPLKEQYAVTFSPDGRFIVAAGADNRIRVWDFISREKPVINPLRHARFAHEGPIVQLAFTPDGAKLVSLAEDRSMKVWETEGYTELKLWEDQPAVAMALAVAGDGDSFAVGRLDGTLAAFAIPPAPAANAADAATAAPPSAPMVVGDMTTIAEQEPNDSVAAAIAVSAPASITGVIEGQHEGQPDADLYRFSAKAGQEWVIDVNAARSKSKLDSFIEILDPEGNRIERLLLQAVRDSYFTFRGKNANQSDDFRIFNWEEMELNEYLYSNGEVVKLWLYPRGPDSGFITYPGQGNRWGYFDTTPLSHALGEPCYIVQPHAPGAEITPNGLPVFPLYWENDDESHRESGADSRLHFTPPADGDYVLRVRDVRGFQGAEFKYTLTIRPRMPDFKVTLHNANPTVNVGSAKEFKVSVQRIDGFEGPVRVDVDGLPPGFSVTSPIIIQEGQIEAFGLISAAADAPAPTADNAKSSTVTASATIRGEELRHDVNNLGEIKVAEAPKFRVAIVPATGGAPPLNPGANGPLEFVIHPGETIMLKVVAERNGHDGLIQFGNQDSGRNLPHGLYVDNIGLNGLMMLDGQNEREFFVTAANWAPEQTRPFFLRSLQEGNQATPAVILHVRPADAVAVDRQ